MTSIVATLVEFITTVMVTIGLPGLFALMVVESFGVPPLPSEVILPLAGFLVVSGDFSLGGAIVASLTGGVVGSFLAYGVGRWGSDWWEHSRFGGGELGRSDLDWMKDWFARRGEITVAVGRLLPIVRGYVSYPAGAGRMNPVRFGVYTLVGATPFTLVLLYAGMLLGAKWNSLGPYFLYLDVVFVAVVVLAVIYFLLRFTGRLTAGWPPRLTRYIAPLPPGADGPPSTRVQ